MSDGNSALADPTPAGQEAAANSDGAPQTPSLEQQNAELREKLARTEEQFSNSSREAHRLVEELKAFKTSQEQKAAPKVQGFISKDEYVRYWTEHDKTEKEATAEYDREKTYFENQMFLSTENQALRNQLRYLEEQNGRTFELTNPQAKEAVEYFRDIPEIDALPVSEKIDRLQKIRAKSPKVEGRDLSALKSSAGGPVGGSGARSIESPDANMDKIAREKGYPSWKALQELTQCKTQADKDSWNRKYKSK